MATISRLNSTSNFDEVTKTAQVVKQNTGDNPKHIFTHIILLMLQAVEDNEKS